MQYTVNVATRVKVDGGVIELPIGTELAVGSGVEIIEDATVVLDGQVYLLEIGDLIEVVGRKQPPIMEVVDIEGPLPDEDVFEDPYDVGHEYDVDPYDVGEEDD